MINELSGWHYHIIITPQTPKGAFLHHYRIPVESGPGRGTCAGVLSFLQQKESTKESAALANRSAWPK